MAAQDNLKMAEQRRLAWRCRRGLLELDIVLQGFVEQQFNCLSQTELMAFDGLLALPDNDFWELVVSDSTTLADANTLTVINKIKTQFQLPESAR